MINREAIIEEFHSMRKEFCHLLEITLYRDFRESEYDCNIDIILSDNTFTDDGKKLYLKFAKVSDYESDRLDSSFWVPSIQITDISSRQMEGINYLVVDDENRSFSFYCSSFSFEIINQ